MELTRIVCDLVTLWKALIIIEVSSVVHVISSVLVYMHVSIIISSLLITARITWGGGYPPPPLPIIDPGTITALLVLSLLQRGINFEKGYFSIQIPPLYFFANSSTDYSTYTFLFCSRCMQGFGFVTFANASDAERARLRMHGLLIEGRRIEVHVSLLSLEYRKEF